MRSLASAEPPPVEGLPMATLELLLAERFGIALSRCQRFAVAALARSLGQKAHDAATLQELLSACCMSETMFLRNRAHFAELVHQIPTLPSSREGAPLAVWSAGCSTGEEAYSLAAVLMRSATAAKVLGTDVNSASIEWARRGHYRLWSLRGIGRSDPEVAWWLSGDGPELAIGAAVRERVGFAVHNLKSDPYPKDLDVIFCRNVLLYFHGTAAEAVLEQFGRSLRPGGLLFLGDVDLTPEDGDLWQEENRGPVRYFRRQESRPRPTQQRIPRISHPSFAGLPRRIPAPQSEEPFAQGLELARGFASQRDFRNAIATLEPLCEAYPLAAAPHVLLSMVASESGGIDLALQAARRACFLLPDSPMTHYLMAHSLRAAGDPHQAAHHVNVAVSRLGCCSADEEFLPYGEGLSARQLRRILDGYV
jgi:chemotaxis protein methyltransferase CheR